MTLKETYFRQPSVMSAQEHFSQVPKADIPRSKFNRSHAYKSTFNAGDLVPVFCDEVLPGDTFSVNQTAFARLATPLKPIMDNIYLDVQYFFVPYRLVWDKWQNFCGERNDPDDDITTLTIPQTSLQFANVAGRLADYFGIPQKPGSLTSISVSALPFRAYALIWNEWYRDQNLQEKMAMSTGDGPDVWNGIDLRKRGKRHDYFTSALPWPQKGDPVVIPLAGPAPVYGIGTPTGAVWSSTAQPDFHEAGGVARQYASRTTNFAIEQDPDNPDYPNIYAQLSEASSVSINELRSAFQIQKLLERDARGGTRYIELILAHFGVRSPDGRLQRPEYLGGSSDHININPVASTAVQTGVPQGNLAATGTGVSKSGWTKSFTEHGVVIGLMSARADLTYQNGVERFWSRQTRYDFYWPALAHLGEQAILNKEIWAEGTAQDDEVFGYQERYAEYRYKPSRITGKFSSLDEETLDVWHLAQDFDSLPLLNSSFIIEQPPIERILAVPTEPHFLVDIWFNFYCDRPMPVYSVPGLIDHF